MCRTLRPSHKHPAVRSWRQANDIELVFTPTNASWLNCIEAKFAALRYFALGGDDHRSHPNKTGPSPTALASVTS
ncbi:hypothetical protein [Saccharopolyspora sp. NPDC049426]|uniref:hypothetical protein n=1 Tax=Saccharopolyspora sp. NPDC049426 TaxID=3155652 RepID=UPI003413F58C